MDRHILLKLKEITRSKHMEIERRTLQTVKNTGREKRWSNGVLGYWSVGDLSDQNVAIIVARTTQTTISVERVSVPASGAGFTFLQSQYRHLLAAHTELDRGEDALPSQPHYQNRSYRSGRFPPCHVHP